MKLYLKSASIFPLLLGAVGAAQSAAPAMSFLRLDVGPGQVGRGGVALGQDPYSMAYNPAWLTRSSSREIGLSHVQWLKDFKYQDLFYVDVFSWGSLGLRLQNLDYGEIQGYDDAGSKTGSFSARALLSALSYAKYLPLQGLSLGGSIKIAQERISDAKAMGILADLGLVWSPWETGVWEDLSIDLALKHLGPPVKFDRDSEPLPRTIDLGAGMKFLENALLAGANLHFPQGRSPYLNLGAEYWFLRQEIALRAGFETGQEQGAGFRVGLGFRLGLTSLNYAFFPMGDLGPTHHFGLTFGFGGAGQRIFREGVRLMREKRPAEAILKFDEVLRLNPHHPDAGRWLRRAHRRIREALKEAE